MAGKKITSTRCKKASTKKVCDPEELHHMIAEEAYRLYEARGCTHGNDWADWFEAEKRIKGKK